MHSVVGRVFVEEPRRVVGAAVVDYEQLEVLEALVQDTSDRSGDELAVVVGCQDYADSGIVRVSP